MYHHKHHAARVAVMNYPAGQDRLIRSWFCGRTRLVNNDKWRHAPSYIILRFCLKLGKPFIFLKFSNLYIFPSGGRVCRARSFATRACFIIHTAAHAEASGAAQHNHSSRNCEFNSAQRHIDGRSAATLFSSISHKWIIWECLPVHYSAVLHS